MASVNPHTRELVFKLVFYGPGLGGKTTTLQYIYASAKPEHRGKMVSLATPTDRTLYFDFLPLRVPKIRGMNVRLQLFTVPGQVYYAATRKLVLSGADGIVFVADSQNGRLEVNQESLDDLHANLAEHNRTLEEVPHTFHWNKRDLGDLATPEALDGRFNAYAAPSLGTVATKGEGVFEGLERITRLVLRNYEKDPKVKIEASAEVTSVSASGSPSATSESPREAVHVPADGVVQALREMEGPAHVEAPTKVSAVVPDLAALRGESVLPREKDVRMARRRESGAHPAVKIGESPSPPGTSDLPVSPRPSSEPRPLSLAELWPEADRENVRQAEGMIAARDAVNAILACELLVTRVLASAAGLVGTLDAPRDPGVVALLLGLDGARYLVFRTLVRAARHRESVSMRDALECFTFALEARRARDTLRR